MRISEITDFIESVASLAMQESYDNAGLIVGSRDTEATGALISLDVTEEVVDEAISLGYNLIIAHHPLVFGGLKKFSGNSSVERTLVKAIKNDVAVYAAHTNLDNMLVNGVNSRIASKLGLEDVKILSPMSGNLRKIVVFVPTANAEAVRNAMFEAGAGSIGNYSRCSYNLQGDGSFKAEEGCNPYVGEIGQTHFEPETRIETIAPKHLVSRVVNAMLSVHPYEEPAFDVYPLDNSFAMAGSGIVGALPKPENAADFLQRVKQIFGCGCIRHTRLPESPIKNVAVCGGAGSFLIGDAMSAGADILLTADIKYHQFFDARYPFVLADIGHYESEQFTKELFYELVTGKFSNFAVRLTKVNTNPIKYV
ncbi:MAG: Nif3-like dinuclear metal center hexameric protein [Salinivirgaceae bacterium]|nr:Nif3-like dinuclear metal center hexameric protein [Salinivirgaceae bacterium]